MRASRRLTIARALILVSLVFGALLAAAALLVIMVDAAGRLPIPGLWTAGALLFLLVKLMGLVLGVTAYRRSRSGQIRNAGILAVVASFFPPFDLIMLLAGLVLLVGGGGSPVSAAPAFGTPGNDAI